MRILRTRPTNDPPFFRHPSPLQSAKPHHAHANRRNRQPCRSGRTVTQFLHRKSRNALRFLAFYRMGYYENAFWYRIRARFHTATVLHRRPAVRGGLYCTGAKSCAFFMPFLCQVILLYTTLQHTTMPYAWLTFTPLHVKNKKPRKPCNC